MTSSSATTPAQAKRRRIRVRAMRMLDVKDSSNIAAVGYDGQRTMRVRFHDGSEYQYSGITAGTFLAMMQADSIGSHFAAYIKGRFTTWRIRRPRKGAHAS